MVLYLLRKTSNFEFEIQENSMNWDAAEWDAVVRQLLLLLELLSTTMAVRGEIGLALDLDQR